VRGESKAVVKAIGRTGPISTTLAPAHRSRGLGRIDSVAPDCGGPTVAADDLA